MDVKQLELEIKEEVLTEMFDELNVLYIDEKSNINVEDFDLVIYGEIERLIGGRITRDKVAYKIRKSYERELENRLKDLDEEFETFHKAIFIKSWLNSLK